MARELSSVVSDIFMGTMARHTCWRSLTTDPRATIMMPNVRYMTIPITENAFEIPTFALYRFADIVRAENRAPNTLIAPLYTLQAASRYTSLKPVMMDVLSERYRDGRLAKIVIRNVNKTYYGTHGAIFDSDYEPLLLCTWQVGRTLAPDGEKFIFFKPLIRISPKCFSPEHDLVTTFITGKFLSDALPIFVPDPGPSLLRSAQLLSPPEAQMPVRAVIDTMPFELTRPARPSINTSNQELLETLRLYSTDLLP